VPRARASGSREDVFALRCRRCGSTNDDQLARRRLLNVREERCATLVHRCGVADPQFGVIEGRYATLVRRSRVTGHQNAANTRRLGATDDQYKVTQSL